MAALHLYRRLPLLLGALMLVSCTEQTLADLPETGQRSWFTGKVSYAYTYTSDSLNADSLATVRTRTGEMIYAGADYLSRFRGLDTMVYLYMSALNKCYSPPHGAEPATCEDYGVPTDSVIKILLTENTDTILGEPCDRLEMTCANASHTYWVARNVKAHPGSYERHEAYNWKEYGTAAKGGIILMNEHRFTKFTMRGIATNFQHAANAGAEINAMKVVGERACK